MLAHPARLAARRARAGVHPLVLRRCPPTERPLAARFRLARDAPARLRGPDRQRLQVGQACWLAEDAWLDNLAPISLGDRVCLSQGTYLCTGNHDFRSPGFDLRLGPIRRWWLGSGSRGGDSPVALV